MGAPAKPRLQIRLLGDLSVARDGHRQALPPSKKTRALLAYLVGTGRPHLREHLCGLLWEGPHDPRAALRWSLTKVRPLLDEPKIERLHADRERVSFEAGGAEIDLNEVRALAARGLDEVTTDELAAAAARFGGAFLEGLDLPGCHRYYAWCVALREEMHALHVAIRTTLVTRLRSSPEAALAHARVLVGLDPLAESSHITVVRLLGEAHRPAEALEQYERCRQLLDRELGGRPSRELEEARMALSRATTTAPTPVAPAARKAVAPAHKPLLVGRAQEQASLARLLEQVRAGQGREVVLVAGDPGVGKSRLLEELVSLTRAAGGHLLAGRAFEAEMVRPYGAWIDALRSGDAIDPASTHALAPLLPELGSPASDGGDRNRLFEAVTAFLLARAEKAGLLLVILDDIQWLDESSAALLHFVARAVEGKPVLLACAARQGELGDNPPVLRLLRTLGRDHRLHQLTLAPLGAEDIARLVASIAPDVDAATIFAGSEGNPLFALEMARARQAGELGPSQTLRALISERLERLDEKARSLLPWAAALGHSFDPQILSHVTGLPMTELLAALDDLERRGVVRGAGAHLYDFAHDLFREMAYQQMSEPRRRLVHLQLARTLSTLPDPDGALTSDVAHHAGLGGDSERAARAYLAAGQRSLRLFAWTEARELVRRGIQHLAGLPRALRLHLHIQLLGVEIFSKPAPSRVRAVGDELNRVLSEAEEAGFHADVAHGYYMRSVLHFRNEERDGALDATWRGVAAGRAADAITAARSMAEAGRCLMLLERELPKARAMLEEASQILDHGDELVITWGLGLLYRYLGEAERAERQLTLACAHARRIDSHWEESECLRALAILALEQDAPARARALCPALLEVADKMGEGSERPVAETIEALCRVLEGEEAEAALERGLAAVRAADAKALLSFLLNVAAAHDLAQRQHARARKRAQEALNAATAVERRNQIAIARSLLARLELVAGDRVAARAHLAETQADRAAPLGLSAHAQRAVDAAARALDA